MGSRSRWIGVGVVALCIELLAARYAPGQPTTAAPQSSPNERERIVSSKALPQMDGKHLKGTLVEVRYGPGESSSPHSHPCAVLVYVVQGAVRTQVKGQEEAIYKTGESFYEAPNDVHLVSANASSTEPARFVAYLICDHDGPLSTGRPQKTPPKVPPQ